MLPNEAKPLNSYIKAYAAAEKIDCAEKLDKLLKQLGYSDNDIKLVTTPTKAIPNDSSLIFPVEYEHCCEVVSTLYLEYCLDTNNWINVEFQE